MSLGPGDVGELVQTSLCAGGLVRTWTESGDARLWRLPDAATFAQMQGIGVVGRTLQGQRRYRESAILYAERGVLAVQAREPVRAKDGSVSVPGRLFDLESAGEPGENVLGDVYALLQRAVSHTAETGEYLVVELGGWGAPEEPYVLFVVGTDDSGPVSVIEAAPPPVESEAWAPHCAEGQHGVTMRAPANPGTIAVVPSLLMEALGTWGCEPWDLALTFGERAPESPQASAR